MLTSLEGRRENDISGDVEGHGEDEDDSKALAWQETLYLEQISIKEPIIAGIKRIQTFTLPD